MGRWVAWVSRRETAAISSLHASVWDTGAEIQPESHGRVRSAVWTPIGDEGQARFTNPISLSQSVEPRPTGSQLRDPRRLSEAEQARCSFERLPRSSHSPTPSKVRPHVRGGMIHGDTTCLAHGRRREGKLPGGMGCEESRAAVIPCRAPSILLGTGFVVLGTGSQSFDVPACPELLGEHKR